MTLFELSMIRFTLHLKPLNSLELKSQISKCLFCLSSSTEGADAQESRNTISRRT